MFHVSPLRRYFRSNIRGQCHVLTAGLGSRCEWVLNLELSNRCKEYAGFCGALGDEVINSIKSVFYTVNYVLF